MPDQSGRGKQASDFNALDRVVSWFSPQRALRRQAARILMRQYAAAKETRLTGGWQPADPPINDLINSSQRQVRSRVRQLVRDFPFFARAVNVLVDTTVGTGINFQARVKNADGTYNKQINDQIEYALLRWMEQADISGKMHFNELVRLSDRSDIEAGESLFVIRKAPGRFVPFALQAIEPDRLAEFQADVTGKNEIEQGVEYDPQTGEALFYHILENGYSYRAKKIPASQVIHTFEPLRPEQMRGISPFASAVLAADDLHTYIDATMDTAKMASKYLAMVTTPDIATFQGLRSTNEGGQKVEELENAIIEYLNPGEQVNFANHQIPNDQFDPFTRFILRMVAVATGTSFELLSGDYSGLSYSNLKAIRADLVRGIKPRFERRKLHFCSPVYRHFLEQASIAGRLSLPGFFADPYPYERCQWIWQGMESPDPLRDGKAAVNLIDSHLMSPQEHAAARGRDYEEILDEIEDAKKQRESRGLQDEEVSTAMANNPASVDPETSDRSDPMNVVPIRKRSGNPEAVVTRSMPVSPASLDKENRAIDVTMATETPVDVYTWEHGIVSEVLLMDGATYADRVPLLDTHDRFTSKAVLGSVSSIRNAGSEMIGRVVFSSTAEDIMTKVEEGHLTDFSVGYRPTRSIFVPENETQVINGRAFDGPVLVTDQWQLKELSICAIGADANAKARAEAFNHKNTEEQKMDQKTREMLIARGLDPNATEEQAWAFFDELTRAEPEPKQTPKTPDPAPEPKIDPDKVRADSAKQERERVTEIMAIGQRYGMADEAKAAVDNSTSLDEFRKAVLDAKMKQPEDPPSYRVEVGSEEPEKVRAAISDGLLIRGGASIEKPAPGSDEFAGYSLREIARETLKRSGQQVPRNTMEMVGRSLTTSDFPLILANVANKFLFEGFDTAQETWREWCATGSVSDFKTHHLVRPSETDDLDEIPEAAEYKYGKRTEAEEQYKVVTYGKMLAITRQAIINDDLSALQDTPRAHGESAARKIGDLPYAVLEANAEMGDGDELFHDNHGNKDSNAAVAIASLNAGFVKMALQKDLQNKRRLNIRPQFYIGPVATMGTVEQFFQTNYIGGETDQPNLVNIYGGGVLKRIYEPRIDDDNANLWYLAGPKGKTITVFFLNGVQTPYMETRQGWSVDGVEYKVRIDAGAKAVDWRALYRNDQ